MRHLHLLLFCEALLQASVTTETVCPRPPEEDGTMVIDGQLFFEKGTEITLSCIQGYRPTGGSRKIVCKSSGEWTERTLQCSLKKCPAPEPPENGEVHFSGITYQSNISYSCDVGFVLHGGRSSQCLHTGQWSSPPPECRAVTCGLPVIPPNAKIVYIRKVEGDDIEFGVGGTYECRPPMVLHGNRVAFCKADGTWSEPPECKLVKCPEPADIENGFLSFAERREYGYMERVRYGCNDTYVLDGPMEIECTENGSWSVKPACKAPCIITINKGHVLYKGQKIRAEDLKPKQIQHLDQVAVYCVDKEQQCEYTVSVQCIDGVLHMPACYEERGTQVTEMCS